MTRRLLCELSRLHSAEARSYRRSYAPNEGPSRERREPDREEAERHNDIAAEIAAWADTLG